MAVPKRWLKKRTTKIAIEMGIISLVTEGLAIAIPATADVTDTAGVNMPSAIVKLVPNRHLSNIQLRKRRGEMTINTPMLVMAIGKSP